MSLANQQIQDRHVGQPHATGPSSAFALRSRPKWQVLCFALTIFLGAFLLFQVQPLVGKAILPWYGGTPHVWTTCLLFFQALLFAGYAYAHVTTQRLPPPAQGIVHGCLAVLALALLPILPAASWKPDGAANPTISILLLLTAHVGLPYFLLAATSPLIQVWWSRTAAPGSPYRLYSLSNAGSLLALISFPLVFEPLLPISFQGTAWSAAFVVFALLVTICGSVSWWGRDKHAAAAAAPPISADTGLASRGDEIATNRPASRLPADATASISWRQRLLWIGFSATGSILLLATTNHICHDIAVVPLLWVAPLSIYLLTFVLCFAGRGYPRVLFMAAMMLATGYIVLDQTDCIALVQDNVRNLTGWEIEIARISGVASSYLVALAVYLFAMFSGCMVCHGELWRLKPPPERLTSFYLYVAFGGALGGIYVGIGGPLLFNGYYELAIGMILCWSLSLYVLYTDRDGSLYDGRPLWAWAMLSAIFCAFAGGLLGHAFRPAPEEIARARNFYGVLTVNEAEKDSPQMHYRSMVNGLILHGLQFRQAEKRRRPTTYYAPASGIGMAMRETASRSDRRLGVVGLGVGTVATHAREGDSVTFYEIDPDVVSFSRKYFTCLKDSPAETEVVLGDARISLERQLAAGELQQFDVLALDAFSGDAIPAHLLTREAFAVYLQQLRDDPDRRGILAVHISNRYVDLRPVLQGLAAHYGLEIAQVDSEENKLRVEYESQWVLMSRPDGLAKITKDTSRVERLEAEMTIPLWTDDFTNILHVLDW